MNSESNQSMKSSTNSLDNSILSDVSYSIIVDQNDQKSPINSKDDQNFNWNRLKQKTDKEFMIPF